MTGCRLGDFDNHAERKQRRESESEGGQSDAEMKSAGDGEGTMDSGDPRLAGVGIESWEQEYGGDDDKRRGNKKMKRSRSGGC